jgi:hypothetical protein
LQHIQIFLIAARELFLIAEPAINSYEETSNFSGCIGYYFLVSNIFIYTSPAKNSGGNNHKSTITWCSPQPDAGFKLEKMVARQNSI